MEDSPLDKFCGSKFWDLNEVWNTTNPDFSECFQKTVLVWAPCGLLWVAAPFEIHYILRRQKLDRILPWTFLNTFKVLLGLLLIIINAADLLEMLRQQSLGVEFLSSDLWPSVIRSLTFLLATLFIYGNKRAGHHTSGILFTFWFFMVVCTIIPYRTELMKALDEDSLPDSVFFITCMISLPLLVAQLILSSFSDYVINKKKDNQLCPLEVASFPSQYFYSWFDKLAWVGFRRSVERGDLWTLLPEYKSTVAYEAFDYHWSKIVSKKQEKLRRTSGRIPVSTSEAPWQPSIIKVIWKIVGLQFLVAMVIMVVCNVIQFVSPLILKELIAFVATDDYVWKGILYAVVIFVGALAQSLLMNNHMFRMQSVGIVARAAIIAAIYRKSLRMSSAAKRMSTTGEIVNLMSVDAQRIMDCFQYLGWVASTPIMLGGALYLLWDLLGPSVFAGVVVMVLMIPINAYLAGKVSKMQSEMMRLKDQRTKLMNEILGGIKVLKLYAWEVSFYKQIDEIRKAELVSLKKILYLQSFTSFIFQLSPFLISLSTFATYLLIDENNYLDATKAFVSLSLFDIMRIPISFLPTVIAMIVQTMISVKRVDKFMTNEEIDEGNISHDLSEECPVVIENGAFAWTSTEDPILRNISVKIPEGALVAVVGTVGAGKSSFLSALIGEMEKRTGRVNVKGTVAYVAQQAWIQNATLRENIIFGKPYNASQYNKVIEACSLKPDLEMLTGGDQTEIGEKGINLSGGQKQRVSLARAVYNDSDVYLLDDPLSAVDAHVGKHLFEHVLGPKGLLRRKTRILVTHGVSYLPKVDMIIVLNNGTISEVGTFQELLKGGGAFSEILLTYLKEQEEIDEIEEEELLELQEGILTSIEDSDLKRRISVGISRALSSDDDSIFEGRRGSKSAKRLSRQKSTESTKSTKSFAEEKKKMASKLIHAEQMETGKVDWAVYFHYFRSIGLSMFIITLIVFALSWTSSMGTNVWLSQWSQDPVPVNGSHDTSLRDLRLGVYGGLGIAQTFFALLGSLTLVLGAIKASKNLHDLMLFNVLRSPMSFFDTTPLGRILNRFSRDVDVTDITIPTFIRPVIDYLFQLIGTLVVISSGVPIFLVAIPPLAILYYCIQRLFIDTSRQLRRLESVSRSPIYTHFSETVGGLSTIRAFRHQDDFIKVSEKRVDENHVYFYPFLVAKRWLGIRLEFVGGITVFFASLFSVLNRETLDPGVVGLVITYSLSVTFLLTWSVRTWTELESNIVSVERMKEYSEIPTEGEWEGHRILPENWPTNGIIKFESYATQYRKDMDLVLKGIDCEIRSGEKIGIVGRTGAGKSSLTLALFRIIESVSGKITIDGIDISEIGLHELRSQLTIIPQDPVLFSGTLRLNLDPFEKCSDHQIWGALEHSHLKDFVSSLPQGLAHEVIEGGENLSVGQRQLVCLARAILRKTKVLILDEATAAIDLETDDLIQATIRKEFAECTVITIAHRLNTIMDSTRVMVLSQGRIKEFDTPANLLHNNKSEFYSMAKDAGLV